MLKRTIFALALAASLSSAFAADSGFGLGFFLGSPTGITGKLMLSQSDCFEAKVAWDFTTLAQNKNAPFLFDFQLNYHLMFPGLFVIKGVDIPPFVGIGAEAIIGDTLPVFAVRFPFGIGYTFEGAPIELQLELGLGMTVFPAMVFRGSGGLAIRFYF